MTWLFFAIPLVHASTLIWPGIPLYVHPVAIVSAALWVWCVLAAIRRLNAKVRDVPWAVLIFSTLLAVNALAAGNEYGRDKVLYWAVTCLPLVFFPLLVQVTRRHIAALACGQLLAGLIVLPTLITGDPDVFGEATYIRTAIFGGVGFLSGWALPRLERLGPVRLAFCAVATVIAGLGCVFSSRGGLIALPIALLALILVQGRGLAKVAATGLVVAAIAALLPSFWTEQVARATERLSAEVLESSTVQRLIAIEGAVDAFSAEPLLGIGAGRYEDLCVDCALPIPADSRVSYPHNLFLELGAEFGIVAVLLMAYILFRAAWSFWKYRDVDRAVAALGMACLVFTLANAMKMGDISMHRQLYLWIGIALALSMRSPVRAPAPPTLAARETS